MPDERDVIVSSSGIDPTERANPAADPISYFSEKHGVNVDPQNPLASMMKAPQEFERALRDMATFARKAEQANRMDDYRSVLEEQKQMMGQLMSVLERESRTISPTSKEGMSITSLQAGLNRAHGTIGGVLSPQGEPEDFDPVGDLRSQARVARSRLRRGEELTSGTRDIFQENMETLTQTVIDLENQFENEPDQAERRRLSMEIASKSNLAQELRNILEHHTKENKNSLDSVMGLVSNVAGALGVGALASSLLISDPFQFQFTPAMGVMGQQGEVGSALSSAMMQEEQYDVQFNQMALMGGMGLAGLGASRMMSGGRAGMLTGGAMMLGGGVLGALGGFGGFNDALQKAGLRESPEQIMGQNLAQTLADPQRILGRFESSRVGLFNLAGGTDTNFGFQFNENARNTLTGNTAIDRIIRGTTMGTGRGGRDNEDTWSRLGYSGDDVGRMLSTIASNVVGSPDEYSEFVGEAAAGYGLDPAAIADLLGTAQRGGSRDATRSVQRAMGSTAVDGNVSNYAMEVLVPALMKVTESMAIRNISRTSEDIEQEVYALRSSLGKSDNQLGTLINTNPEAFSRVMQTIEMGVKSSLDDPARLSLDLMLGSNVGDIIQGRAGVMERRMGAYMSVFGGPGSFGDRSFEDMINSPQDYTRLLGVGEALGIQDPQLMFQLMQSYDTGNFVTEGGELTAEAKAAIKEAEDRGRSEVEQRAEQIIESELGDTLQALAEQVNAMQVASQSLFGSMQDIQKDLLTIIEDDTITELAKDSMKEIITALEEALGINTSSETQQEAEALGSPLLTTRDNEDKIREILSGNDMNEEQINALINNEAFEGIFEGSNLMMMRGRGAVDISEAGDFAVGGFTGRGGRSDVAGFVHGGEYVISDNNVRTNKELLDRIQSGENLQEGKGAFNSTLSGGGAMTTLTMRFRGMGTNEMYSLAQKAAEDYIIKNRIHYD